jgi:hypothetical protein
MQGITVTVAVAAIAGGATPTGTVMLTSGSYSSAITTLSSGSALIGIPANALGAGSNTLNAVYTPDAASAPVYRGASGTSLVTVTKVTPIVVVTPSATSISRAQPLTVTVAVNRGSGNVAPGGTVTLASGSYTSAPATLSSGQIAGGGQRHAGGSLRAGLFQFITLQRSHWNFFCGDRDQDHADSSGDALLH